MLSMNELFEFYLNKFRSSITNSNIQQVLTFHRNPAQLLLLKVRVLLLVLILINNELQRFYIAEPKDLVTSS